MSYVHHIPGRIRVRSTLVKHNPACARMVENWIRSIEGVHGVVINPTTGSILIHYRSGAIDGDRLIAQMRDRKWITGSEAPQERSKIVKSLALKPAQRTVGRVVAAAVLKYAAQAALERSVVALASAVL